MLIGRRREEQALARAISDLDRGRAVRVCLVGEPGIGKTSLLRQALEGAGTRTVLRTTGVEGDAEVPFTGLWELVQPAQRWLDRLEDRYRTAIERACSPADAHDVDPMLVRASVLSLLATVAASGPVVCAVDDAHWLDGPSGEVLAFAARRLTLEPVAFLVATRPPVPPAFATRVFDRIDLAGLAASEAPVLLPGLAAPVAVALAGRTAGNPLAMLELAASLDDDERSGRRSLTIDLPVPRLLDEAFAERVRSAPADARLAAVVAGLAERPASPPITAAAAALGVGPEAFEAAEAHGLLLLGQGEISFPHPLIRAVVVASVDPAQRRAVHAALAEVLRDPADADRRAWHLAAAAIGQDAGIAALLEEAAGRVAARGGREYEARLLDRSADLTPDRDLRATRRVWAARAHRGAGDLDAAGHALDRATEDTSDNAAIGVILAERARLLGARGDSDQAVALLVEHARRLDGTADGVARRMRLLAAQELLAVGRPGAARDVLAEAPAAGDDAQAAFTLARVLLETGAPTARTVAQSAIDHAKSSQDPRLAAAAAVLLIEGGGIAGAHSVALWAVRQLRDQGDPTALAAALRTVSLIERIRGRLPAATSAATEAAQIAIELRLGRALVGARMLIALAEATRGTRDAADLLDTAIGEARAAGLRHLEATGIAGQGRLALLDGRYADAVGALRNADRLLDDAGFAPSVRLTSAELVEALVRTDRHDEARAAAEVLAPLAGGPNAYAAALAQRALGLVAGPGAFDGPLQESISQLARLDCRFELGRSELVYAERLLATDRTTEARTAAQDACRHLSEAGAPAWTERAERVLAAMGTTIEPVRETLAARLTAKELEVALSVAEGLRNQEIGDRLFLSVKTVEYHLRNTFRKLEIRTRGELTRRVVAEGALAGRSVGR